MASAGGLGGADTAGAASVRQLAATAVLTVALWGARLVAVVWRCRGTRSVGWDRSRAGFGCGGATSRFRKGTEGHGGLVTCSSSPSKLEVMPNLAVHSGCLTKCQRHLGSSWSGQILQISVSMDVREGGEVGLQKGETC